MQKLTRQEFEDHVLGCHCDIMTLSDTSHHKKPKYEISSGIADKEFITSRCTELTEFKVYNPDERFEVFYLFKKNNISVPRTQLYCIQQFDREVILII